MNLIDDEKIDKYVDKFTLKNMIYIPVILFVISILILSYTAFTNRDTGILGSPVKLGIEFKGGTVMIFDSMKTPEQLKEEFKEYNIIQAREYGGTNRKMIQFGPMDNDKLTEISKKVNSEYKNVEIRQMGEVVSKSLQMQSIYALFLSFIGMAIVVFIIFRTVIPSFAVALSAFIDIIFAAAMMDLANITLSLGTVAALLMLIGYSVDTDILLTNRLLKRRGELNQKIKDAMKTGLTMTTTTLAALVILFIVSSGYLYFIRIDIIRDISIVLIFGLVADIVNTWITNLGILKWYIENKTGNIGKKKVKSKKIGAV